MISLTQGTLHIYLKHSIGIHFVKLMAPFVLWSFTSPTVSSETVFCDINHVSSLFLGITYFTLCFRFRLAVEENSFRCFNFSPGAILTTGSNFAISTFFFIVSIIIFYIYCTFQNMFHSLKMISILNHAKYFNK